LKFKFAVTYSGLGSDFRSAHSLLAFQISVDGVIKEHIVFIEVVLGFDFIELRLSSKTVFGFLYTVNEIKNCNCLLIIAKTYIFVLNVLFKLVHGSRGFLSHVLLLGQIS
jgi:hypothetical protein